MRRKTTAVLACEFLQGVSYNAKTSLASIVDRPTAERGETGAKDHSRVEQVGLRDYAFGQAGNGIFPSPAAISEEIEQMYRCRRIGPAIAVEEKYYAISPERKLKHPAVVQIIESAREALFD